MKACEQLRANINRYTSTPQTIGELVEHYRQKEMAEDGGKAYSTRAAYETIFVNGLYRAGARAVCRKCAGFK
jgi:hypothetical protein